MPTTGRLRRLHSVLAHVCSVTGSPQIWLIPIYYSIFFYLLPGLPQCPFRSPGVVIWSALPIMKGIWPVGTSSPLRAGPGLCQGKALPSASCSLRDLTTDHPTSVRLYYPCGLRSAQNKPQPTYVVIYSVVCVGLLSEANCHS